MNKKFLILICVIIFSCVTNIFAFGIKGGFSLGNGLQLGAIFSETNNSGLVAGVAVPITFESVTVFFEYYYDFLFIDKGSFNMGVEVGIGGRLGMAFSNSNNVSSAAMAYGFYPMAGLKVGLLQNNLDIYAVYDPVFGSATAVASSGGSSATAEASFFQPLSFSVGIRYHF